MTFRSIVAGVDASEAGLLAATTGRDLVGRIEGASCRLVHVTAYVPSLPPTLKPSVDLAKLEESVEESARLVMEDSLRGHVPTEMIESLDVRRGRPAWILPLVMREVGADLLILGGKHHSAAHRWFGGSTVHHAVRALDVPTLIVVPERPAISRILVAVDLSHAIGDVLGWAERLAELWNTRVRIVHTVEPVPYYGEYPLIVDHAEYVQWAKDHFRELVGRFWKGADAEHLVREGPVANTLATECEEWGADLVILGSHGKGWMDRMLIGSTTQRMLNRLPASLFVVPVGRPPDEDEQIADAEPRRAKAAAARH